jgi:innexin
LSQRPAKIGCSISLRTVCSVSSGNYLVSLYIIVKLLHLVNVVGQLFVLNTFLGQSFHLYGIDVLRALTAGNDWTMSPRFPRVTMCDFKIRHLANVQRYTVQCVLPVNLFNEKIFLFVWFWLAFVAAITSASLLIWMLRVINRHRYVKKHLCMMDSLSRVADDVGDRATAEFVQDYLRQDGVFIVHLVGHNTNAIAVTEFVYSLWETFRRRSKTDATEDYDVASTPL